MTISSAGRSSCVFPRSRSITAPDRQLLPICRLEARQKRPRAYGIGVGTSATTRSGPPMAGIMMKVARSFDTRTKPIERPSGEKAGLMSSAGSVVSRVRRRRANQLDVDIEVVLLLPVPGKDDLIAIRRKARELLNTRIAGEWDHFGCGLPVFWQSRERASRRWLSPRQRVQLPPKPRIRRARPHRGWCPGQLARVGFFLQFLQLYLDDHPCVGSAVPDPFAGSD